MRTVVAAIPAGVGLDAALAVLHGLGDCYPPHALSLGNDAAGGMRVLYDPDVADPAAAAATRVEVGLGTAVPEDLLRFAFSADDQQDGVRALALALVGMLEDAGAANFLTYTVELPGAGRYALTVQRCDGATPAERIAALEAQIAEPGPDASRPVVELDAPALAGAVMTAYYVHEDDGYAFWVDDDAGSVVLGNTLETTSVERALAERGFVLLGAFTPVVTGDHDEQVYAAPLRRS